MSKMTKIDPRICLKVYCVQIEVSQMFNRNFSRVMLLGSKLLKKYEIMGKLDRVPKCSILGSQNLGLRGGGWAPVPLDPLVVLMTRPLGLLPLKV